jgi:activator of HSP90 ATPase
LSRTRGHEEERMPITRLNRREFSLGLAVLLPGLEAAGQTEPAWNPGISETAQAIHQEVSFPANAKRIYALLLDARQFSKMTGGVATEINPEVGGAFSLFGGLIRGRQVDLVPGERIVQAWRSESWKPHLYSLASFVLAPEGPGTRLVFEHTGFPTGQAEHLASGWREHYWAPMKKFLAS